MKARTFETCKITIHCIKSKTFVLILCLSFLTTKILLKQSFVDFTRDFIFLWYSWFLLQHCLSIYHRVGTGNYSQLIEFVWWNTILTAEIGGAMSGIFSEFVRLSLCITMSGHSSPIWHQQQCGGSVADKHHTTSVTVCRGTWTRSFLSHFLLVSTHKHNLAQYHTAN